MFLKEALYSKIINTSISRVIPLFTSSQQDTFENKMIPNFPPSPLKMEHSVMLFYFPQKEEIRLWRDLYMALQGFKFILLVKTHERNF